MFQVVRTKQKLRKVIAASKKIVKSTNGSQSYVISKIEKNEIQQVKESSKINSDNFNKQFYPNKPDQVFPESLQENVIKIITSFGKSTTFQKIYNNLSLFYKNVIDQQILQKYFAFAEEKGIIYERQGQYFVSSELIPNSEINICENPQQDTNQQNKLINLNCLSIKNKKDQRQENLSFQENKQSTQKCFERQ